MRRIMLAFSGLICLTIIGCATMESSQRIEVGPPAYIHFSPGKIKGETVEMARGIEFLVTATGYEPKSICKDIDFIFSARVFDANGNPININPVWKAENPDVILITPNIGNEVTIKGIKEGVTDIMIEVNEVRRIVKGITVLDQIPESDVKFVDFPEK